MPVYDLQEVVVDGKQERVSTGFWHKREMPVFPGLFSSSLLLRLQLAGPKWCVGSSSADGVLAP